MSDPATRDGEFPPVTVARWRARVEEELGGADFETLVTELDGVGRVEPLYTAESAGSGGFGPPGAAPFVRGSSATENRWSNCPIYTRWSPEEVRREILADLRGGADGVYLRLDRAVRRGALEAAHVGRDGVAIHRLDDLRNALDGVHLEMIELCVEAGGRATETAALLLALIRERGLDPSTLRVSFGFDPLGTLATDGALPRPLAGYGAEMATLCRHVAAEMPMCRVATISSRGYHGAGADPALELASVVATLVEYLRWLGGGGVSPVDAARRIELSIGLGKDLFVNVAKLRALRGLWSRVLEVAGAGEAVRPFVHAISAERSLTARDPWVNILRVTSQAIAAAAGGADRITTAGFDQAVRVPSDLSRRVARNTQLILAEESGFDAVVDPAGGSYYVESLTRAIAREAWSRFQEIERLGGFGRALVEGDVASRVAAACRRRHERLARRDPAITGVSAFPNLSEAPLGGSDPLAAEEARHMAEVGAAGEAAEDLELDRLVARAEVGESVFELGGGGAATTLDALPQHSDAAVFEALRARGEQLPQPAVFLANVGSLREHKARSSFVREALAVGGLAADVGPGTEAGDPDSTAADLIAQFRASPAGAACLCGTDEQYGELGEAAVRALADAGAAPLLVAGRPASAEVLAEAGAGSFLTARCDLVAFLTEVLDGLEGARS